MTINAWMRLLQDETVQLVVNKTYDKDWANQYKAIMSGQTNVRAENIEAMNRVASILQHRTTQNQNSRYQSGKCRVNRFPRGRGQHRETHSVPHSYQSRDVTANQGEDHASPQD